MEHKVKANTEHRDFETTLIEWTKETNGGKENEASEGRESSEGGKGQIRCRKDECGVDYGTTPEDRCVQNGRRVCSDSEGDNGDKAEL